MNKNFNPSIVDKIILLKHLSTTFDFLFCSLICLDFPSLWRVEYLYYHSKPCYRPMLESQTQFREQWHGHRIIRLQSNDPQRGRRGILTVLGLKMICSPRVWWSSEHHFSLKGRTQTKIDKEGLTDVFQVTLKKVLSAEIGLSVL